MGSQSAKQAAHRLQVSDYYVARSGWCNPTGSTYYVSQRRSRSGHVIGTRSIIFADLKHDRQASRYFGKWKSLRRYKHGKLGLNSPS